MVFRETDPAAPMTNRLSANEEEFLSKLVPVLHEYLP
jgi:hypothetical protein